MVFRSFGPASNPIKWECEVDPIFLDLTTAVPVSLILNELVSNCLKHAFPDGRSGGVTVQFKRTEAGQLQLRVRDNGAGLSLDFAIAQAQSLGLRLVKILADQLGGRFTFDCNSGTEFRVTFAEPQNTKGAEHAQSTDHGGG